MATLRILNPNDQPTGKVRLLTELKTSLSSDEFHTFLMAVAFVKVGPLIRLQSEIERWRAKGKTIKGIWGINHMGTSQQALAFALNYFDSMHVLFAGEYLTFHPKMYLFLGPRRSRFFIGSHNLTVGGTETNWEGGIVVDMQSPEDQETIDESMVAWDSLHSLATEITTKNFGDLVASGLLCDESKRADRNRGLNKSGTATFNAGTGAFTFPKFVSRPPSPLPVSTFAVEKKPPVKSATTNVTLSKSKLPVTSPAEALLIQIVPHANGEVFLSKRATDQNPEFFGFPWTGQTVPKIPGNVPYLQRVPDPIVNITIHNKSGTPSVSIRNLNLNTVYYEQKSEIRITVPPSVVKHTPDYSILMMKAAESSDADYDLDIFPPDTPEFPHYLAACNQTLPSGGKSVARKMGWL